MKKHNDMIFEVLNKINRKYITEVQFWIFKFSITQPTRIIFFVVGQQTATF